MRPGVCHTPTRLIASVLWTLPGWWRHRTSVVPAAVNATELTVIIPHRPALTGLTVLPLTRAASASNRLRSVSHLLSPSLARNGKGVPPPPLKRGHAHAAAAPVHNPCLSRFALPLPLPRSGPYSQFLPRTGKKRVVLARISVFQFRGLICAAAPPVPPSS